MGTEQRYTAERIRQYWAEQAQLHGTAPASSWSDVCAIELEIREISKHLADGDKVVDLGCGTGYSTVRYAAAERITVRDIDYVPEMVEQARSRVAKLAPDLRHCIDFAVGDVRELGEQSESYDKAIVTRTIINLGEWKRQQEGLHHCARVLKPGGLLLLSEATEQGWCKLNAFRHEWELPAIPMPPFNNYLDVDRVVDALSPKLDLVTLVDFASTYYVGTRVLKPLLINALGAGVDVADPLMHWNRWFSELPPWGAYGVQKLFVFRKKG